MENFITIGLLGIFLRWSVSQFPYSGAGKPPMYGDYEAQRHWQEITVNLPINEWYTNTSKNDLQYWGLDYPPLTAYHSYFCGLVAKLLNPDYIELQSSRGYESYEHKLFMRYTVLVADLLIYIPAAYFISKTLKFKSSVSMLSCFAALILYPGLYLIDYGHFQYNNVSLGLLLAAVAFLFKNKDCTASFFFTLALNYKQMELYHALPFFFYLLGKCSKEKTYLNGMKKLIQIGFTVVVTFLCCWAPFLGDLKLVQQVLLRVFPIARGLFEDKVANIWCSLSVIIKFKSLFDNATMALICLSTTAVCILPSSIHLLMHPKPNVLKYALVNSSFIFFLCSFHVHEKSILLVVIPACLIFPENPLSVTWFFIISIISMLPLLVRDGLGIPTLSLAVISHLFLKFASSGDISNYSLSKFNICQIAYKISLLILSIVVLISMVIKPPSKLPDLYPVLISLYCCLHYSLFCLYFHYCQFKVGNANKVDVATKKDKTKRKKK